MDDNIRQLIKDTIKNIDFLLTSYDKASFRDNELNNCRDMLLEWLKETE